MSKIAVLGYGVVGSGTVEVFYKTKQNVEQKTGKEMDIKYILDLRDFPDSPYKSKFTKDFNIILSDTEVDIVVEVLGGLSPAFEYVKSALEAGKSVVSSNKELIAAHGATLLRIAKENNVNIFFEASVGGGIPIIRPIHQCLIANEINEIAGILNGTTNFILTKMIRDTMSFEDALTLAKELGYAERDPSADVDGHDACRKICILSSLAFGKHVYPNQVHTEGISSITSADVEYATSWGGVIKLIARSARAGENINAIVSPAFISYNSQLSSVDDVFNGILVRGDATGDVVFYGKGAGKLPTASAVVADIIEAARATKTNQTLTWVDSDKNMVVDYKQVETAKYVRLSCKDSEAAFKIVEKVFGKVERLLRKGGKNDELAFITPVLKEVKIDERLSKLEAEGLKALSTIRVMDSI